jgi:hypothetical protein
MDESELEARLSRRLHGRFDGGVAPRELRDAVHESMTSQKAAGVRRLTRSSLFALPRQLLAVAAVVVVLVIAIVALAGRQDSVGVPQPSAIASAIPSPSGSTPPASATPSPSQPVSTVPPISTAAWSGLNVHELVGAPAISMIVPWSGGYVAIGQTSTAGPLRAWLSVDGRAWTELPATTFGLDDPTNNTFVVAGTACAAGVLVGTEDASGQDFLWASRDGRTWSHDVAPWGGRVSMAGGSGGAVATTGSGPAIEFTSDCASWQRVTLAGLSTVQVTAVAAFGDGYVALDASSPDTSQPHAWWSTDGQHWSSATVQHAPGDQFTQVLAGASGLAATSHAGGTPGRETMWTSSDGHAWNISTADPFGVRAGGEGVGDPAGSFTGDGTRLLGWGTNGDAVGPAEYWLSSDGQHWTKLAIAGNEPTSSVGGLQAFVMRDGVLFSTDSGSWFGDAVTK